MAAPKKQTKKRAGGKAAPMTYESTRLPNVRQQLAAAARGEDGPVDVGAIIEDTGKEK